MESIWNKSAKKPHFDSLKGDKDTKVLIIGGGIAGILCAYELQRAGVPYILLEAKSICSGVTENTTAKLTFQHGLIYHKIINRYGIETAMKYYRAQKEAISHFVDILKNIDCDLTVNDSYVFSLKNNRKIEKEVTALKRLGVDASICQRTELPFSVAGAVKVKDQFLFHPLKALYEIASNLNIYENTKVLELADHCAKTEHGRVTAEKIIIATHFPILNKHGLYYLKMYQHRSYVAAFKNAPQFNGMYVDESGKGLSLRSYGDILLVGGGGHRTGKKGTAWREIEQFKNTYCINATEVCRWSTQDCKTLDDIPYIGQYSINTPDLFVATGFNKWGMSSSVVSAMILSDLVQGRDNKYADVFSPSRSLLHKQLAINAAETTVNLLTPTKPRCPHLGCALKYNAEEHSWDCPCHGSRFDEDGRLLNNPATDDIGIDKKYN